MLTCPCTQHFNGCGNNTVYDLNQVEFRNDGWGTAWKRDEWICMDRVELI